MKTITSLLAVAAVLTGCKSMLPEKTTAEGDPVHAKTEPASNVSLSFLLSMDFEEASAISAQKAAVPPFIKVAADTIEVIKTNPDGTPRKVRAKGHVFVQFDYAQQGRALCQEALISSEDVILRGNPVLQRGQSTIEGASDITVFYVMGTRLRALGPHKATNVSAMMRDSRRLSGAWKNGPNPLLPPLEATDVPDDVRDELRKAIEAETMLQQSRIGVAPAFPDAKPTESAPLLPAIEVPDPKPVKAPEPKKEAPAKPVPTKDQDKKAKP